MIRLTALLGLAALGCTSTSTNPSGGGGAPSTGGGGSSGGGGVTSGGASGDGGAAGSASGGAAGAAADASIACSFNPSQQPTCPPLGVKGANLLFHVAFEDEASTETPLVGTMPWPSSASGISQTNFSAGACGNAAHFATAADFVDYPETDGTTAIVDYSNGTMMLWYRPDYDPLVDTADHTLVRPTNVGSASSGLGGVWLDIGGTYLQAHVNPVPGTGAGAIARVKLKSCKMAANQWAHIAISWKMQEPIRVFAAGSAVSVEHFALPPEAPSGTVRIPSTAEQIQLGRHQTASAAGMIDDFRIYDQPLP